MLGTTITLLALNAFAKQFQKRWGESRREQLGRLSLNIPEIKTKYKDDNFKQIIHFQEDVRKKWKPFEPLITTTPEDRMDLISSLEFVDRYSQITASGVKDKIVSGTIYSKSLDKDNESIKVIKGDEKPTEELNDTKHENLQAKDSEEKSTEDLENNEHEKLQTNKSDEKSKENHTDKIRVNLETIKWKERSEESFSDDAEYFSYLSKKLEILFTYAFQKSYLWNSLHSDEFPVGPCIDYQDVRMIASMFGGKPDEVMGFKTSGGTESLMLAVRIYREWGMKNRGHGAGEGVIIASKDVHAAILKGGASSLVNVKLVETDENGKVNIEHLKALVEEHGNKVVAIIGSAPSYPKGTKDNIIEMAKIAQENGCGLHVDCCLGAFIVDEPYLTIPGVTTLSADDHKFGFAPKGSSTLVTKTLVDYVLGEINLSYYSFYALPDWSGGLYGSPADAGSKSCVHSFTAFLAKLAIGKKGYARIAKAILKTTSQLVELINQHEGNLKLVVQPEADVVTFQIDKKWGLQKGAIHAFAKEMAKRDVILNILNNDLAHFTVTARFASDQKALDKFKTAIKQSLDAIEEANEDLKKKGKPFPESGMYCSLEAALNPKKEELTMEKYIQNFLLGKQGAKDAVRGYFLAQLDPYKNYATVG